MSTEAYKQIMLSVQKSRQKRPTYTLVSELTKTRRGSNLCEGVSEWDDGERSGREKRWEWTAVKGRGSGSLP